MQRSFQLTRYYDSHACCVQSLALICDHDYDFDHDLSTGAVAAEHEVKVQSGLGLISFHCSIDGSY